MNLPSKNSKTRIAMLKKLIIFMDYSWAEISHDEKSKESFIYDKEKKKKIKYGELLKAIEAGLFGSEELDVAGLTSDERKVIREDLENILGLNADYLKKGAVTMKEIKKEAEARMKMLKIIPQTIKEFTDEDKLNKSENGILYWLDEKEKKMVEEAEKNYNFKVYHVIKNHTNIGIMYSMLYVSQERELWKYDREDIENGIAIAYVYNETYPPYSEAGSIYVEPRFGGVARVF